MPIGFSDGVLEFAATDQLAKISDTVITKTEHTLDDGCVLQNATSFDDGVHYTPCNLAALNKIEPAGDQGKQKFTISSPAEITPSGNKVFGRIDGYAYYFIE